MSLENVSLARASRCLFALLYLLLSVWSSYIYNLFIRCNLTAQYFSDLVLSHLLEKNEQKIFTKILFSEAVFFKN